MAITPDGKYGYVTNSNYYEIPGNNSVTVFDLEKGILDIVAIKNNQIVKRVVELFGQFSIVIM